MSARKVYAIIYSYYPSDDYDYRPVLMAVASTMRLASKIIVDARLGLFAKDGYSSSGHYHVRSMNLQTERNYK